IKFVKKSTNHFGIINNTSGFYISYTYHGMALSGLASIESDQKRKLETIENNNKITLEGLKLLKDWKRLYAYPYRPLSENLFQLSKLEKETQKKKDLLLEAQFYIKEFINFTKEMIPYFFALHGSGYLQWALIENELANLEPNKTNKLDLLNHAVSSLETSIKLSNRKKKLLQSSWASGFYFGQTYNTLGNILRQVHKVSKEDNILRKSLDAYSNAAIFFKKSKTPTYLAESFWHLGKIYDLLRKYKKASKNYEKASKAYTLAAKKIPELKQF
ncbi:MAG: hypothetical protein P8Y18_12300, partial [Candidatus Bathyarchaeota archaeon]